jgi:hypothetical protein
MTVALTSVARQGKKSKKCNHVWVPIYRTVLCYGVEELELKPAKAKVICMLCGKPQENPFE